jgi:hypothetical protein
VSKPLDELYLVWLYNQVGDPAIENPARTYWRMLRQLYTKEFVWVVPNDDNRVEDGKDLRYEFVDQSGLTDVPLDWIHLGSSMLEVLVGLSRRLSFEADGEPRDWFWELIDNLNLHRYNDKRYDVKPETAEKVIDTVLDRVIWRTYSMDGRGGLFPLKSTTQDQRDVELWYQLSAYVLEKT